MWDMMLKTELKKSVSCVYQFIMYSKVDVYIWLKQVLLRSSW